MTSDPHSTDMPSPQAVPETDRESLQATRDGLRKLGTEVAAWIGWIDRFLDPALAADERQAAPFAAARAGKAASMVADTLKSGELDAALCITRVACRVDGGTDAADIHGPSDLGPPKSKAKPEAD